MSIFVFKSRNNTRAVQNLPPKICLVGHSLASGGAERAMASLSRFFHQKGIEVHIITVVDRIEFDYSGTLFNLGKFDGRLTKFLKLKSYLSKNQFDYIIDFRMRPNSWQEWLIARVLYKAPTVYTIHSARFDWYLPSTAGYAFAVYGHAINMVAVGEGMAKLLKRYRFDNLKMIPNPLDTETIKHQSLQPIDQTQPYILAVGRLDENKQFDKLIRSYANSILPSKNIELVALGDGPLADDLRKLVADMNLVDFVKFKGSVANPYPYFKDALFTVLSSKNEGLPTVLLESLCLGTPVVSFDCPTGPREIIRHRENGILVADQDFNQLTTAMDEMGTDDAFRQQCTQNASVGIQRYSLENVGRQWLDLLKIRLS